ncbi:MAG: hypothetical protein Q9170_001549 [Blastenia crenularia]
MSFGEGDEAGVVGEREIPKENASYPSSNHVLFHTWKERRLFQNQYIIASHGKKASGCPSKTPSGTTSIQIIEAWTERATSNCFGARDQEVFVQWNLHYKNSFN